MAVMPHFKYKRVVIMNDVYSSSQINKVYLNLDGQFAQVPCLYLSKVRNSITFFEHYPEKNENFKSSVAQSLVEPSMNDISVVSSSIW